MSDGARAYAESRGDDALTAFRKRVAAMGTARETRRQAQSLYSEAMGSTGALYDWSDVANRARRPPRCTNSSVRAVDARNAMLTAGNSLMEVAQSPGIEGQRASEDASGGAPRHSLAADEALGNDLRSRDRRELHRSRVLATAAVAETQHFREAQKHIGAPASCSWVSPNGARS